MDRLLVVSVGVSVLGLVGLAWLAHAWETPTVPLDDLARWEGQRICVDARLAHLRLGEDSARFLLADSERSLAGWSPFLLDAATGDVLHACGVLGRTGTGYELHPARPADVSIKERWDAAARPLAVLAQRPWEFQGLHVVVHGRIVRDGSVGYLTDGVSRLRVSGDVDGWVDLEGRLEGLLEYDRDRGLFHLEPERFEAMA